MVLGRFLGIMAAVIIASFCFYEILDNPPIVACRIMVNTVEKKDTNK